MLTYNRLCEYDPERAKSLQGFASSPSLHITLSLLRTLASRACLSAMSTTATRRYQVPACHELRFELETPTDAISITLTSGYAEVFGFELVPGATYGFGNEQRGAVWAAGVNGEGAELEMSPIPSLSHLSRMRWTSQEGSEYVRECSARWNRARERNTVEYKQLISGRDAALLCSSGDSEGSRTGL